MSELLHLILTGVLTPEQTLTYIHLPFEIPEGIERMDVEYDYDAAISSDPTLSGGNTIDIGIFDPRGTEFLNAGYRGWSGSARRSFSVGCTGATPGYMPGPIYPGTWSICLGAYKVAPNGCHYRVNIRLYPSDSAPVVNFPQRLPLDNTTTTALKPDGWYIGELHCHTVNSDGDSTTAEIVDRAKALGLDFLAITDHNNLTHQLDLNRLQSQSPLLLIPGYEVTTYYGHWNIWGDGAWVDFRIQSPDDLARAIAFARGEGYLVSCNHPRPYGPDWAFHEIEGYDCVEVWNGPWELLNTVCLDFWETRLKRGERLTAVGGSDHHFSHEPHIAQLGHPCMVVSIDPAQPPTARQILASIRAGHCFVTESPTGPRLTLRAGDAMMGDILPRPPDDRVTLELEVQHGVSGVLQVLGAAGLLAQQTITRDHESVTMDVILNGSLYLRAQLYDPTSGHLRVVTNPIYFS